MAQQTRRGVLAAVGLTVTAGCSQLPLVGGSNDSLRGKQVDQRSATFTLKKGQFKPFHLSLDRRTVVEFSVVADEQVDVFAFAPDQFRTYKSRSGEVSFIDELSEQGTKATAQGSAVALEKIVHVVDNTTWGRTDPDGEVQVDVELEAFLRADGG